MHTGGKSVTENEVFKFTFLNTNETSQSASLNSSLTLPTNVTKLGSLSNDDDDVEDDA